MQTTDAQDAVALEDWATREDLIASNPRVITPSTLNWQLKNRHKNGLAFAVARVGRRLMISRSRYTAWLASRAGDAV